MTMSGSLEPKNDVDPRTIQSQVHFIVSISTQRAAEEHELFAEIAKLNDRWWSDSKDSA